MSTGGHDSGNPGNPVNPSDDTQPHPAIGAAEDAGTQSRRKFLRTAVISGVAVATVGTSAGVAAAAAQPHTGVLKRLGITNPFGAASGPASCTMCLETSGFKKITDFNEKVGDEFWLWFTAHHLAAGKYTLTIQQDPGGSAFASAPFQYIAGNEVKLFKLPAGSAPDCPKNESGDSQKVAQGHVVADCFPYSWSGSSADLQLNVHFQWAGPASSGNQLYTFTGTLTNVDSGKVVCTASISATGHAAKK